MDLWLAFGVVSTAALLVLWRETRKAWTRIEKRAMADWICAGMILAWIAGIVAMAATDNTASAKPKVEAPWHYGPMDSR